MVVKIRVVMIIVPFYEFDMSSDRSGNNCSERVLITTSYNKALFPLVSKVIRTCFHFA